MSPGEKAFQTIVSILQRGMIRLHEIAHYLYTKGTRKLSKEGIVYLQSLRHAGMKNAEICNLTGLCRSTVYRYCGSGG